MTTIASLKELYSLGFIQDVEYLARLALLGVCDPNPSDDPVEDIAPVEPTYDEPVVESVPEVIEVEPAFVTIEAPKPVVVPIPKPVRPPRREPPKPRRPKTKKLITKPKRPLRRVKPLRRRFWSTGRVIARGFEQNVHLADSISEKDRRRDRYLKSVHHRVRNRNRELIRNFRAAKKWSAHKNDKHTKIRKTRVDGTESKLFEAHIAKRHVILHNKRGMLFDRNVLAMKELRSYFSAIAQLNEQEET